MTFKERIINVLHKLKNMWKAGKIQRSSRITYGVVWNIILFFLVIGFIGLFFVGGIGAGYFASLVKDEEILDYETMSQDIYDYAETSRIFFADDVYFGEVSADIHRDETTLDQIAPLLIDAVIATEDEYFNEHQGIVPKAIMRAVIQEVTSSETQSGGSTLTQQLIKNQILTNEVSFERKAKEILLALRLERFFEKDEILEAYLNIVPYGRDASGRNIAGIQTAANGIFGIDANEVNLAQAAYLAGLPQSPSSYTPFASGGGLKNEDSIQAGLNRMTTVLNRMYDMEYITKEEYDKALDYDIVADFKEEEKSPFEQYPILTAEIQERAEEILFDHFVEEDGYTAQDIKARPKLKDEYNIKASRALRMNGYEIHSTIDKQMYDAFQEVAKNYPNYGPNTMTNGEEQYVQTAGIMIENSTGRIISFLGSREYSLEDQINYTKAIRSNGSTMKPILVYGPALEEGLVQPGTPIADVTLNVGDGGGTKEISNIDLRHHGLLSARTQLAKSYNVPAVRTYLSLIDINPVEKYLREMGITTIRDDEYVNPSLAIGGTTDGITLEENTNAFSTVANGGQFVDAYLIEKITTKEGETIFENEPNPVEVFSPQTSYLLTDMMRDVINNGTATHVKSQLKYSNVDWSGKTGTSQNADNVHFVASNPNITFGTWMGYEFLDSLICNTCNMHYSHQNMNLWAALINAASDINPELVAPQHAFQQPEGIVSISYCAISGLLPSELCERAGLVKTDLFNEKFVPTKTDNSLITGRQVAVGGNSVSAGPNTSSEFTKGDGLMFNPEFLKEKGYDKLSDLTELIPTTEDRSKWEKIGFPGAGATSQSSIADDGKAPTAPSSVKASGNKLTWNASGSKDVVGYRIYEASGPGGNFSRIGSTTSTEFSIGKTNAVYHIRAVDYFGMESSPSPTVIVGETPKDDKETPDKDEEAKDNDTDKKEEKVKDKEEEKDNSKNEDEDEVKKEKKDKDKEKE